ncbi:imm11 family protein [Neptuniibacter sp. PT8_73]|uniref:imm11 family protein n=1 Tax=Neptuniibacter sp. PT8_73 TaxID=3398206 RepID=UPI0039F616E7
MYFLKTTTTFNGVFSVSLSDEARKSVPIQQMPLFTYRHSLRNTNNNINFIDKAKIVYIEDSRVEFMNFPLKIKSCRGNKIPDIFTRVDGYHLVSNEFKDFVESVDPKTHDFWESHLYVGGELVKGYFLMQIGRVLDFEGENIDGSDKKRLKLYADKIESSEGVLEGVIDFPFFSLSGMEKGFVVSQKVFSLLCSQEFYGFWEDGSVSEKKYGSLYQKLI